MAVTLIREASKFNGAIEAQNGYFILLMCSGAIFDDENWKEWLAKEMYEYSFSLPKGEACRQLRQSLDELYTLIPLDDRCLGRARMLASSALK